MEQRKGGLGRCRRWSRARGRRKLISRGPQGGQYAINCVRRARREFKFGFQIIQEFTNLF